MISFIYLFIQTVGDRKKSLTQLFLYCVTYTLF